MAGWQGRPTMITIQRLAMGINRRFSDSYSFTSSMPVASVNHGTLGVQQQRIRNEKDEEEGGNNNSNRRYKATHHTHEHFI